MYNSSIFLILISCCYLLCSPCYSETDTLKQGRQLKDWDYLISSNRVFTLKFFGFNSTISPYLGIFYNQIYTRDGVYPSYKDKAVWVANRNNPILDIYSKLMLDVHGKLTILSSQGTVLDLFRPTLVTRNVSATLLDSGNFVLQQLYPDGSVKRVLWQSFDYPTDTLLPGMKLGVNLKTGHRWALTSWWSEEVPAKGSFTFTGDPNVTGQLAILWRGNIQWMSGPWRNGQFDNTPYLNSSGPDVRLYYVSNETEQSFTYLTKTFELFPRLMLMACGGILAYPVKINPHCFSIINPSPGCVEYQFENLKCRKGYYLISKYSYRIASVYDYIYRDEYVYDESHNMTLDDCERICWRNCSCTAFAYSTKNICKTYGQMIYNPKEGRIHTDAEYYAIIYVGEKKMKKWMWWLIGVGSLVPLLSCYFVDKKLDVRGNVKKIKKLLLHQLGRFYSNKQTDGNTNKELHYFTFQSISSATNNFSSRNKLGEGGFGAVYKGILVDGQEVAVKRLSRSSGQGVTEFKNETELIAKLQHINLVRLLGCCIEKQEKILVYEYMPNNSLDFLLFDPRKKRLLDWKIRFVIIDGIAQGLVYLHKFSRLKVVHRDLKASNILLDVNLNPKISDFGMAKLFGINEYEATTTRVVGTRGYMPPEYMRGGTVSTKTDVFSFGVLLLEIVSSNMNHGSYDVEHPLNLLGLAWELWNEGRGFEMMDPGLKDSCIHEEVMTCIHVGLLCVQAHAMDRPTMSEVISMLTNENMLLPDPKQPAFYIERHGAEATRDDNLRNESINRQSISIVLAR